MRGRSATTAEEARVFIPCADEFLSAVLTEPTVAANGRAVVFWPGKAMAIGRSALFVHMARELAALGYHSLRFDYIGLGESTGTEREWKLEEPLSEEPPVVRDWLAARGLTELVLVGTCFGARTVLSFADQVEHLLGLVLISTPVRDFERGTQTASLPAGEFVRQAFSKRVLSGLRDPYRRRRYVHHLRVKLRGVWRRARGETLPESGLISSEFLKPLEAQVARRTPMLMIYGDEDGYYREFRRARSARLGQVLERAGDVITLEVFPGRFFGLPQFDVQRTAMASLEPWLDRLGARTPTAATATRD